MLMLVMLTPPSSLNQRSLLIGMWACAECETIYFCLCVARDHRCAIADSKSNTCCMVLGILGLSTTDTYTEQNSK